MSTPSSDNAPASVPTLSIVVPAYNEGPRIGACLDAITRQKSAVEEIIVVDNGSGDDTAQRVRDYAETSPVPVRLISEPRKGTVHARTAGYDAVTSDLIGRIDVDTALPDDWAGRVVEFFARHGDVYGAASGFCTAYDLPFQDKFAAAQSSMSENLARALETGGDIDQERVFGSNMAISREAWWAVRDSLTDSTRKFEDLDLSLTLTEHQYRIALVPGLIATISGRRYLTPLPLYLKYARREMTTYLDHGMRRERRQAWVRLFIVTVPFYLAMFVPFRLYDPRTQRFDPRRLRPSRDARSSSPTWT